MLFGISQKKHAAEVAELQTHIKLLESNLDDAGKLARNKLQALQDNLVKELNLRHQKEQRLQDCDRVRQEAEGRCKLAEENLATLTATHATRIRIGSVNIDPIEMTSRLRGTINSSLRVEWDGQKLVIYGNRELTEPELNQLKSVLAWELNRT